MVTTAARVQKNKLFPSFHTLVTCFGFGKKAEIDSTPCIGRVSLMHTLAGEEIQRTGRACCALLHWLSYDWGITACSGNSQLKVNIWSNGD